MIGRDRSPGAAAAKRALRRGLDGLYSLCGYIGAAFLVAIAAIVSAQVFGNALDRLLIISVGRPIGIVIPAYSDFAGFFLAASTFFTLTYAFTRGEHIRVHFLLERLPTGLRRGVEIWCCALASLISGTITYFAAHLVYESWRFGDIVPGMVAIPLWIPQMALLIGVAILTLAFLDALVTLLAGGRPAYDRSAEEAPL